MQLLAILGLFLDAIGAVIFIVDSNRLSGLLAGMVKHIAQDHGKYDSTKFSKNEIQNLQASIHSSRLYSRWGYGFLLIGFLLQIIANIAQAV